MAVLLTEVSQLSFPARIGLFARMLRRTPRAITRARFCSQSRHDEALQEPRLLSRPFLQRRFRSAGQKMPWLSNWSNVKSWHRGIIRQPLLSQPQEIICSQCFSTSSRELQQQPASSAAKDFAFFQRTILRKQGEVAKELWKKLQSLAAADEEAEQKYLEEFQALGGVNMLVESLDQKQDVERNMGIWLLLCQCAREPASATELIELGVLERAHDVFSELQDRSQQAIYLFLLNNVSIHDETCSKLLGRDPYIHDFLDGLLANDDAIPATIANCIANFAVSEENRVSLARIGCIETLIDSLRVTRRSDRVTLAVLDALANLVSGNEGRQNQVVKHKGLGDIVLLLTSFSSQEVHEAAAWALSQIVNDNFVAQETLLGLGGVELLCQKLLTVDHQFVVRNSIVALLAASRGNAKVTERLCREDVSSQLYRMLSDDEELPETKTFASELLKEIQTQD